MNDLPLMAPGISQKSDFDQQFGQKSSTMTSMSSTTNLTFTESTMEVQPQTTTKSPFMNRTRTFFFFNDTEPLGQKLLFKDDDAVIPNDLMNHCQTSQLRAEQFNFLEECRSSDFFVKHFN